MKMLQFELTDGTTVKLSIVKVLGHGFYLTKPNLKLQKRGVAGPFQITHASGCRLASGSKAEVMEQVYLGVVANPTVQAALTEMVGAVGQQASRGIWMKHIKTMDAAIRDAYAAFVNSGF